MISEPEAVEEQKKISKSLVIATISVFIILIILGTWQANRLEWKEGLISKYQAELKRIPITLADLPSVKPKKFRRVQVIGKYLHRLQIFVGPKPYRGNAGWHVVTPFQLETGDIILINRGWVPLSFRNNLEAKIEKRNNKSAVVGVINWPRKRNYFDPVNIPEKNQWFRVDTAAIANKLHLKNVPSYWISINKKKKSNKFPIGGVGTKMPINNHLQYVWTWFGLAFGLLILSIVYWRQRYR